MNESQKPHRLVLTEGQTAFIRSQGIRFAIVHPGSTEVNGRMVLDLFEIDREAGNAAVRVAQGISRESRPRKAKS